MREDTKTAQAKASGSLDRLIWVDTAKGIGIVLVVLGHVLVGLNGAGLINDKKMYTLAFDIIYSFHMPLFFFLSGLFFLHSYTKRGALSLIGNKMSTIVYPFVIWSAIQIIIEATLANYTNNDESFGHLLTMLLYPKSQFWFLQALFLMFVSYALLFSIFKHRAIWITTLLALCLFIFQDSLLMHMAITDNVIRNIIYFNAGIVLVYTVKSFTSSTGMVICAIGLFTALVYGEFIWADIQLSQASLWFVLAAAFSGIWMVLSISIQRYSFIEWSTKIFGKYSMEIYIMHILFASGVRIILQKFFGIQEFWLHLMSGMAAGLFLPLVTLYLINKFHMRFLLQPPGWMALQR